MLGKIMQKNNIMWRCLFTLLLALGGGIHFRGYRY